MPEQHPTRSMVLKNLRACIPPFVLGFLLLGSNCAIRNPQEPSAGQLELSEFSAPPAFHLRSDSTLVVSVRVGNIQKPGVVASVRCLIVPDVSTLPAWSGAMEDDGLRGDLIAGDGIYAVRLDSARLALLPGSVRIGVAAIESANFTGDTLWAACIVTDDRRNAPPTLVDASVQDVLLMSQSASVSLTASAEDPDGLNDIDSVLVEAFPPLAASPRFTIPLAPTDVPGQYRGDALPPVFYPNRPTLSAVSLPDEVNRLASTPILLSVRVPDSAAVPASVYFITTKPDGSTSGPFAMFDDGNATSHGDQTAGDRIYSLVITINSSNQLGDYRFDFYADAGTAKSDTWLFRFTAADKSGQKSLPVVREMAVEGSSASEPALTHWIAVRDYVESL
jgi:hypothetical protein